MERQTDTLSTYSEAVRDLCYHPAGDRIACIAGAALQIWHVKQLMPTFKQTYSEQLNGTPRKLAYSTKGDLVALLSKDRCAVIDMNTGNCVSTIAVSNNANLKFTADDRHVILANSSRVVLWNHQTNEMLTIKTHQEAVTALALSRDHHYLASADARGVIHIIDLRNNADVCNYNAKHTVLALAFFHKSPRIASTDANPHHMFYNYEKRKVDQDHFRSSDNQQMSIDVSPDDSTFLAVGTDGRIYVHDIASGQRTEQIQIHNKGINTIMFSPDGKNFASASSDGTIRICPMQKASHLH